MAKTVSSLVLLVVCTLLCSCHESFAEKTAREAREYSENKCPQRIDDYTLMDSVVFTIEDSCMTYFYTVDGLLDNDSLYTDQIKEVFSQELATSLRNNLETKSLKEHGYGFAYRYFSATTHKEYMSIRLTSEDYR